MKTFFTYCGNGKRGTGYILHTSQVAHQAGAYPGFCSMKRLGPGFLLLPGWDVSLSQGYPQHYVCRYPFTQLTRVVRKVKNAIHWINHYPADKC